MKLLTQITLLAVSLLILSGCVAKVTPKQEAIIDDTLPIIKLTKNGTIADINAIALEWGSFNDQRVKGIYIYRVALSEETKPKDEYYDTVDNRFATHYLDNDVTPSSKYSYYFKTFSDEAESRRSTITTIESLPLMESTTWIHSVSNMPRSAKIIWRPHTNQKVEKYSVQRRTLESKNWTNVATIKGRLNAEYIDKELKDEYTYIYRVSSVTFDGLTSNPSKEVNVITKALPNELINIQATTNLAKKIEITWEKATIVDFSHFNIYRSSGVAGTYKLIAKRSKNFYLDTIKKDAKQYFYRVSTVDKDGLESIHDNYSIQGTTIVKPKAPSVVEARLVDGVIKISWHNSDTRIVSYIVQKKYSKNLFESTIEDFQNIKGTEFIDFEIKADTSYYYKVFGVDKSGVISNSSIEVEIKIAKELPAKTYKKKSKIIKQEVKNAPIEDIGYKEDVVTPVLDF